MLQVSANAETLVIDEEVGSPATYTKRYRHPEWPGGASGVTIAIGYDCGYSSIPRLHSDWGGIIVQGMVDALSPACGLKGQSAKMYLPIVRPKVDISFEQAMEVFDKLDKPRWLNTLESRLPNCSELAPDCVGALWSLIFNRGASFDLTGDRYREMHAIKVHMINKQYDKIPAEFRSMKRLWNNGLVGRREREAKLFERGLSIMKGVHTEQTAPKVATRTQAARKAATTLATTSATAAGGAAVVSPQPKEVEGHQALFLAIVIVIGFVVGGGIMLWVGRHQKLPAADPA